MNHIDPDLYWYTRISRDKGVRPRCPFASVHRCPRFYQSLSLLGGAGSTKIEPKEDQRLIEKWEKSDLWPTTSEQATSIMGEPGKPSIYLNFCPEVAFERFGLFAVSLARYADGIGSDAAHARLGEEGAPGTDWCWAWSHVAPIHYTECPLFSPLDLDVSRSGAREDGQDAPGDVPHALLRAIWNWSPLWRGVALTVIILLVVTFAVWVSLPDRTKERLLDAFSDKAVQQTQPNNP